MLLVAIFALVVLLLGGCVSGVSVSAPDPSPSLTPVFASEEEALAAAEAAYAAYQTTSDQILADGGKGSERIDSVATESVADSEKEGFAHFEAQGYRSVGQTTFTNLRLESLADSGDTDIVRIYLCSDVAAVDILDPSGRSIVSPARPDRTAFEVGFDLLNTDELIVSSKDVWSGTGVCN